MARDPSPAWYLDVQGNRAGPYTIEQIQGLLSEGEIPPAQKVTADYLNGRWVTVTELLQAYQQGQAQATRGHFEPPPRPQGNEPAPLEQAQEDSTRQLFSTLQLARDRKTAQRASGASELSPTDWGQLARPSRRIPPQLWLIASIAAVLGIGVWGAITLLKKTPDPLGGLASGLHGSEPPANRAGSPRFGSAPAGSALPANPGPVPLPPAPRGFSAPPTAPSRGGRPSFPPVFSAPQPRSVPPPRPANELREEQERELERERQAEDRKEPTDTFGVQPGTPEPNRDDTRRDERPIDPGSEGQSID